MTFKNDIYKEISDHVNKNHGVTMSAFKSTEVGKKYYAKMDELKRLDGKKVRVSYVNKIDIATLTNTKEGRISVCGDNVKFYENGNRTKYQTLDVGLFEGFLATIIPLEIEIIKKYSIKRW
jgi:hypothetical protein